MNYLQTLELSQMLSVASLIVIGFIAYRTLLTFADLQTKRKYVLKSFLKEGQENNKQVSTASFLDRIQSWERYKSFVNIKLDEAKSTLTFKQFMMKRFFFGGAAAIYTIGIGTVLDVPIISLLSIPLTVMLFNLPMKQLKKRKLSYQRQIRLELPGYLSALSVLINTRSPQNAIKESGGFSGPTLSPYVERLITEIELYPASTIPYDNFARDVEVREAREFMIALQQMMTVDEKDAKQILQTQLNNMAKLQKLTYKEEIENRSNVLEGFAISMLGPLLFATFSIVGLLIYSQAQVISNI